MSDDPFAQINEDDKKLPVDEAGPSSVAGEEGPPKKKQKKEKKHKKQDMPEDEDFEDDGEIDDEATFLEAEGTRRSRQTVTPLRDSPTRCAAADGEADHAAEIGELEDEQEEDIAALRARIAQQKAAYEADGGAYTDDDEDEEEEDDEEEEEEEAIHS